MTLRWPFPKDPNEVELYTVDWRASGALGAEIIVSSVFTVVSGTVVIDSQSNTNTLSQVTISGGADGERAQIQCSIITDTARTLEETIILWIADSALRNVTRYTKGDLVIQALGDLGIANYVFDTEAEEDIAALRRLDSMMAEWQAKLEEFGYLQPTISGGSLPSDPVGIDESMVDAVIANLATRLAPSYGKTPAPGLFRAAATGRSTVFSTYAKSAEIPFNSLSPMGAGNRWRRRTYFPPAP